MSNEQEKLQSFIEEVGTDTIPDVAHAEALVGRSFQVVCPEGDTEISLCLTEVEKNGGQGASEPELRPDSFAMIYEGPRDPYLKDAMYKLVPDEGEPFLLYISCKGPSSSREVMVYEAIVAS